MHDLSHPLVQNIGVELLKSEPALYQPFPGIVDHSRREIRHPLCWEPLEKTTIELLEKVLFMGSWIMSSGWFPIHEFKV
jgi:hypothetical protein